MAAMLADKQSWRFERLQLAEAMLKILANDGSMLTIWKPSPQCLTSSLLGSFCCIVRLLVQTISCVFSGLTWSCPSPVPMMQVCGSVCAPYSGSTDTSCEEVATLSASLPLALGGLGLEERCSHQCHRSLGKLGRHPAHDPPASSCCGHQNCACSSTGSRFTSVGRSQTSSSGTGRGPRAEWAKGWMATRSGQSRGEAVPNNVGFTTAFTVKKGHVEVPERTSGRSCFLCFPLFSLAAFPANFVPCSSAATPCSSLTFDFAQLPVWPSSRRLWPPPGSVL